MKTILKILLIGLLTALLLFILGRYGWRIAGFAACDDPKVNYVESVTVEGDKVSIIGGTGDSFSAYVGCIHEIAEGKLYLGIKHNGFLGFLQRVGDFQLALPTNGQSISAVYLKGSGTERLIWTQADGMVEGQPAAETPPQQDSIAAEESIVQASYPFDGIDGKNDLCAVIFLGYDESSAKDTVSRLCSQYAVLHDVFIAGDVAEFDAGGDEQYLIVPKYAGTTITVTQVELGEDGELRPVGEPLTTQSILRVHANYSDIVPSSQVTVAYQQQTGTFHPFISLESGNIGEMDRAYTPIY